MSRDIDHPHVSSSCSHATPCSYGLKCSTFKNQYHEYLSVSSDTDSTYENKYEMTNFCKDKDSDAQFPEMYFFPGDLEGTKSIKSDQ